MASSVISCKNSRVQLNGANTYYATKWTVDIKADEIDVTNFESGGFTEYITAYVDSNISVDSIWNAAVNDFTAAGQINTGRVITNLKLFLSTAAGAPCFTFPSAIIISVTPDASVRDAMRYSFTARNQGSFSYPGGLVFNGS